ncbi:MAG: hypothetical protein JXB03_01990 [Spirochaetales bacterium]|nr:hypothetical protein [Spirochaetales bacterium]
MKHKLMLLALALIFIFLSCEEEKEDRPVHVQWEGMWEHSGAGFGTFVLDITLSGEYMAYPAGRGTVSGTLVLMGIQDELISSSSVTGTWENNLDAGTDEFEYEISTADSLVTMRDTLSYTTAAQLNGNEYTIGSITLEDIQGSFQALPLAVRAAVPTVESAAVLSRDINCLDLTLVEGTLYAVCGDDDARELVTIDPIDGTVTNVSTDCPFPAAIAWDGVHGWLLNYHEPENGSLYRYSGSSFTAVDIGYPVVNAELNGISALTVRDNNLYGISGGWAWSTIGLIDTATTGVTTVLGEGFGGPEGLARTSGLAASGGDFLTVYFAAGGEWCRIQQLDDEGEIAAYVFCPSNETGPIAAEENTLYLVYSSPARLFVIEL